MGKNPVWWNPDIKHRPTQTSPGAYQEPLFFFFFPAFFSSLAFLASLAPDFSTSLNKVSLIKARKFEISDINMGLWPSISFNFQYLKLVKKKHFYK